MIDHNKVVKEIREWIETNEDHSPAPKYWIEQGGRCCKACSLLAAYDDMKAKRDSALEQIKKEHKQCQQDNVHPCKFCFDNGLAT